MSSFFQSVKKGVENRIQKFRINIVDGRFTPLKKNDLIEAVNHVLKDKRFTKQYGPLSTWNTEHITDMSRLFENIKDFTGEGITNWNVSRVTNMSYMFFRCSNFNQHLAWDVSRVENMSYMFFECSNFNQHLAWDVSRVENMYRMFEDCVKFNQPVDFDTQLVTNMHNMFSGCKTFNQPINFNTQNVTDMCSMFSGCAKFNQPVKFTDTQNVINMCSMFYGCADFNQSVNFDTRNVTNMESMFYKCADFNQSVNFDTRNVTNMHNMFTGCTKFNQPVNFDTRNVAYMLEMFKNCENFNQPVNFDTHRVVYMDSMFYRCANFNEPVNFTDTQTVRNMEAMFFGCKKFNQPINFNTINIISARNMFSGCDNFNQPINFNLTNCSRMENMFNGCGQLNQPLTFNIQNIAVTDISHHMFTGCTNLRNTINFTIEMQSFARLSAILVERQLNYPLLRERLINLFGINTDITTILFISDNRTVFTVSNDVNANNNLPVDFIQQQLDIEEAERRQIMDERPRDRRITDIHETFCKISPIINKFAKLLFDEIKRVKNIRKIDPQWLTETYIYDQFTKVELNDTDKTRLKKLIIKGFDTDKMRNIVGLTVYYIFNVNQNTEIQQQYATNFIDSGWNAYTTDTSKTNTKKSDTSCSKGIIERFIKLFMEICATQCGSGDEEGCTGVIREIAELTAFTLVNMNEIASEYLKRTDLKHSLDGFIQFATVRLNEINEKFDNKLSDEEIKNVLDDLLETAGHPENYIEDMKSGGKRRHKTRKMKINKKQNTRRYRYVRNNSRRKYKM